MRTVALPFSRTSRTSSSTLRRCCGTLLAAVVVLSSCSSELPQADDTTVELTPDTSDGAAGDSSADNASAEDTASAEAAAGVAGGYEATEGSASQLRMLHDLLPSIDDLGDEWQRWPVPVLEIPDDCEFVPSQAKTGVVFLRFSEANLIGGELRFGISQFETEAEAEADLAWINSEQSALCDQLMIPQLEERLQQSSGGAYSVGGSAVGAEVASPSIDETPFDDHPGVRVAMTSRRYDMQYVGQNEDLNVVVEITALQFGNSVVWVDRVGPSEEELPEEGVAMLLELGGRVLDAGPLPSDPSVDSLGVRARASVAPDLIPDRFDPFGAAVLKGPEQLGDCDSPDPTTALFELHGPTWSSIQGRAGEQLEFEVLAFDSEASAVDFWDSLVTDGAECLATAPIWEAPDFVDPSIDQRLVSHSVDHPDETGSSDEVTDVLVLTSSASQKFADLEVPVEFSVFYVRRAEMIFIFEYAGLAGDGEFVLDLVVEASRRSDP